MPYKMRKNPFVFFGILGPIVILSSILIAIFFSPWFSWENNALSDLGISNAGFIFNGGSIVAGLMTILFSINFYSKKQRSIPDIILGALFFFNGITSIGIGIFNTGFGFYHDIFAVSYFYLALMLLLGISLKSFMQDHNLVFGISSMGLACAGILVWIFTPFPGVAIPEAITGLLFGIWQIMFSITLINTKIGED